jgi:hypothetical protein
MSASGSKRRSELISIAYWLWHCNARGLMIAGDAKFIVAAGTIGSSQEKGNIARPIPRPVAGLEDPPNYDDVVPSWLFAMHPISLFSRDMLCECDNRTSYGTVATVRPSRKTRGSFFVASAPQTSCSGTLFRPSCRRSRSTPPARCVTCCRPARRGGRSPASCTTTRTTAQRPMHDHHA